MKVRTARFGEIEVDESELIRFPKGILGFEGISRYVLIPYREGSPFSFLQAVDEPALSFLVTEPSWFYPNYRVKVYRDDLAAIDLREGDDVTVLAIVRVPKDAREMTANLLAPLVVNARTRLAKQVVQQDTLYSTRHKIAPADARASAGRAGSVEADATSREAVPLVKIG